MPAANIEQEKVTHSFAGHPAADYVLGLFDANDWVCVALIRGKAIVQWFRRAEVVAGEEFLQKLDRRNKDGFNIYVCMNPLSHGIEKRAKERVTVIRNVYIDADEGGEAVLQKISASEKVPNPTVVVQTSPGKIQAVWSVEGFSPNEQEQLNKALVAEFGTDPAATDCVRVLRLPGFANCKYPEKPIAKILHESFDGRLSAYGRADFTFDLSVSTNGNGAHAERTPFVAPKTWREGERNSGLLKTASSLRAKGLGDAAVLAATLEENEDKCEPPLDKTEVESVVRSALRPEYKKKDTQWREAHAKTVESEPEPIVTTVKVLEQPDMPEGVLTGRLGEIYQKHLREFPIAWAWIALATGASVVIPPCVGIRTNLFTCLVGPVHTGKTQCVAWALALLGIAAPKLYEVFAGSAEGLLRKLSKSDGESRLLSPDELGHLLSKAKIDNASFPYVLNSAYYKSRFDVLVARGKEMPFHCNLSLIGGVVDTMFDDVFGKATVGGLYDRFTFGAAPTGYAFDYRPFNGQALTLHEPVAVEIDREVWEAKVAWNKERRINARIIEQGIRIATICASMDGRKVLRATDLDPVFAFAEYQSNIRTLLQPNPGENFDARLARKFLTYIERYGPHGEWLEVREMLRRTHAYDLGVGYDKVLNQLHNSGEVEYKTTSVQGGVKKVVRRRV